MEWILGSMLLVSLASSFTAIMRWLRWKALAESQAKEIERLKNVTKLHCDQIDTLQKEKKGWHNKNKLLNDTNDKLVQRNMELFDLLRDLKARLSDDHTRAIGIIDNSTQFVSGKSDLVDAANRALEQLNNGTLDPDYYIYPEQGDDE